MHSQYQVVLLPGVASSTSTSANVQSSARLLHDNNFRVYKQIMIQKHYIHIMLYVILLLDRYILVNKAFFLHKHTHTHTHTYIYIYIYIYIYFIGSYTIANFLIGGINLLERMYCFAHLRQNVQPWKYGGYRSCSTLDKEVFSQNNILQLIFFHDFGVHN